MKPLPTESYPVRKESEKPASALSSVLPTAGAGYSNANRRVSSGCPLQKVYPWLLGTSTLVAAVFCVMYISKPVYVAAPGPQAFAQANASGTSPDLPAPDAMLLPDGGKLPGEVAVKPLPSDQLGSISPAAGPGSFEETNLRVQHVLTAETPEGDLTRVLLDVPVLYQSRTLRWTESEVAKARELLARLADHQEKVRSLRDEGSGLLIEWNELVERSIPTNELRADSPTLPANQGDSADAPRPAGLDTTRSIKIQPTGK
jgi:hypothetical protein